MFCSIGCQPIAAAFSLFFASLSTHNSLSHYLQALELISFLGLTLIVWCFQGHSLRVLTMAFRQFEQKMDPLLIYLLSSQIQCLRTQALLPLKLPGVIFFKLVQLSKDSGQYFEVLCICNGFHYRGFLGNRRLFSSANLHAFSNLFELAEQTRNPQIEQCSQSSL